MHKTLTTKIIRLRNLFILLLLAFAVYAVLKMWILPADPDSEFSAGYVAPGTLTRDFGVIELVEYYVFMLQDRFQGYPWVIRLAFIIIVISLTMALYVFLFLLRFVFKQIRNRQIRNKLYDTYYYPLKGIITESGNLEQAEIEDRLSYDGKPLKRGYIKNLLTMLLKLQDEVKQNLNTHNRDIAYRLLGVDQYVVDVLGSNDHKESVRVLQTMRILGVNIPPSLMARLVNSHHHNLRSAARIYYIMSNNSNPYELLDNDYLNKQFTPWDALNLHATMNTCKMLGRGMPPYLALLKDLKTPLMTAYMIYGVGFWGSDKEVKEMSRYFNSDDRECREAAYSVMGLRKCVSEESEMMERYWSENEKTRQLIIQFIFKMHTGNAVDFYRKAYEETASEVTKLHALYALSHYSDESKEVFKELQQQARPEKQILFQHVQDKLIEKQWKEGTNERVFV